MIRSCQRISKTGREWVALLALALVWSASGAWAVSQKPMTTDEIIDASEQIFVAVCEGRSSEFRNGNIFTSYKLRPVEVWKGGLQLNAAGVLELEEVGGSVEGQVLASQLPGAESDATAPAVRVNQFVGGAANMIIGEEVLLFTETATLDPALVSRGKVSPYKSGNLRIIGRSLGRFSVLTDPSTGEKCITRIGVEGRGVVPNDAAVRAFLNAQQRQLAAQSPGGDPSAPAASAPALDDVLKAVGAGDDAKSAAIQKGKARAKSARALGTLTGEIQDFDSLARIKERVVSRVGAKAAK